MAKFTSGILGLKELKEKLSGIATVSFTKEEADAIGQKVVAEMKDLISKGVFPIRGAGIPSRFPSYKNPRKYPGKRKNQTPVNLYLTGDFQKDLDYDVEKRKNGYAAVVGYSSPSETVKEKGHREGHNGQPERPTIPIFSQGEAFARRIEDVYLKAALDSIDRKTKK